MMLLRAKRSNIITAVVFLFFFCCIAVPSVNAQLRNTKVSTSQNERYYHRRSPDKVKGRNPKEPLEKEEHHRQLTPSTKQHHKQKTDVWVSSYYYKRIEHNKPDAESEQDEHVYYMPKKESPSKKSSKSLAFGNKSKEGPMVIESYMEKRLIRHRHSRQGAASSFEKSSKELEIESDKESHVYYEPYRHDSQEPATEIRSDREERFYKSDRQSSHVPESSPGTPISEAKRESEIESDMETRRFYPRARQQRLNPELAAKTEHVYTPFRDKIFGNGSVNITAPTEVLQKQERGYTPYSDRIYGHEPAMINNVQEVPLTEEEVLGNEHS